jgi:UDP-N-acetylmuramoyl-tripeptide--D-alanyl-D-alanine ligase
MSGFWTLARVARALGGGPCDDRPIRAVCTDTRAIERGDLFVALKGEHHDAHDYLAQAVANGAAAVVVQRAEAAIGLGVPAYVVDDTVHALGQLGRARRLAWGGPVVAVGGSNGKTSTKELIRAALGARLNVHATKGNLNNQIGVPLTLLAIPDGADIAVIELGTNLPGEIALLRAIVEPSIAVVTTVQEEHLEGFGDLAGVMREEASLLDGVATAIVPSDEPALVSESIRRARRTVTAGVGSGDVMAIAINLSADGTGSVTVDGAQIKIPLRGRHNLNNAMLALAVARECGMQIEDAGAAIAAMDVTSMPSMRSAIEHIGEALLINDAYNSNPGSARAALALLKQVGGGRQRVAVLGTMRELGAASERAHADIAREAIGSGATIVAGIGDFAAALARVAPHDDRIVIANDIEELWPKLEPRLAADAVILLKASRGVRLERLLPHLTAWASQDVSPYRTS